jgi:hypothetical protein
MWYTLKVSGTPTRKEIDMKKETIFKSIGDNIGVIDKHECKNGYTVKLMNDDWGWYVRVVDKDHTIHYDGSVILEYKEAKNEFDEIVTIYR